MRWRPWLLARFGEFFCLREVQEADSGPARTPSVGRTTAPRPLRRTRTPVVACRSRASQQTLLPTELVGGYQ